MAGGSLADDGWSQELAALVEHGLLDDVVGPEQERLRDRQAERLRGIQIDDQLELCGLFDGRSAGLAPLRILST